MFKAFTQEQFIEKAKLIHGDRYDYSKVKYTGSKNKIIVICKIHGEFTTIPNCVLLGQNCPKCRGRYKKTEEVISEFKKVHGDKYDYSKVNYIDNKTKLEIICKKHNFSFFQIYHNHLGGHGCPKCGFETTQKCSTKNTEIFIEQSKKVHGDNYNYDEVKYTGYNIPVKIYCKKHNEFFMQKPVNHLQYKGCKKCAKEKIVNKLTKNTEEFIKESKLIHKDRYDYSRVNYVNGKVPVELFCNVCKNWIFQAPKFNCKGCGCPCCAGVNKTTEHLNQQFKEVHGDKYDYSLVNYVNAKTKVSIICKKHGVFKQSPNSHIWGNGCPKCNYSKGEKLIDNFLINSNINFKTQYKFEDCRNKKPLSFDFAVYKNNELIFLIEYQGQQHYEQINFNVKEKIKKDNTLEQIQYRDKIKKEYCKNKGIPLLVIPYYENPIQEIKVFMMFL